MAEPRFYFDEHVPRAVAHGLRHRGVDVLTVQEAGRSGLSDSDQLAFAAAQGRVVMTHDPDYLQLAAAGIEHAESPSVTRPSTSQGHCCKHCSSSVQQ